MIIIPDERIRRYIAYSYEEGTWIHDPQMPSELLEAFERFKQQIDDSKETSGDEEQ